MISFHFVHFALCARLSMRNVPLAIFHLCHARGSVSNFIVSALYPCGFFCRSWKQKQCVFLSNQVTWYPVYQLSGRIQSVLMLKYVTNQRLQIDCNSIKMVYLRRTNTHTHTQNVHRKISDRTHNSWEYWYAWLKSISHNNKLIKLNQKICLGDIDSFRMDKLGTLICYQ